MRQNVNASLFCHTLLTKGVAGFNKSLRLSVPLLGFRQLRSKLLAGRLHTSTVNGGDERPTKHYWCRYYEICCCDVARRSLFLSCEGKERMKCIEEGRGEVC